jgi:hypothetical protein
MFAGVYQGVLYLTSTKRCRLSKSARFDLYPKCLCEHSLRFKTRQLGEDARFGSRGEADSADNEVAIDQGVEVKCLLR